MIADQALIDAAQKLHGHILRQHWTGQTVTGPDPGIRFNARIWRFVKGYLNFIPWKDNLTYAQAQKYWILSNWQMIDLGIADAKTSQDIAITCADYLLNKQVAAGYWEYPNPEWKGRIATVEGNYASMGMLETYLHTQHEPYLEAAKKWYHYAVEHIGFQRKGEQLAINYFGNLGTLMIPNNAASAVRIFSLLAKAANDDQYLEHCTGLVTFMRKVQLETGELPYGVASPIRPEAKDRIHFLCYNYNAFQFLNCLDYYHFSGDERIVSVLENLARFVAAGITEQGAAMYECGKELPDVAYYTAAAGAALAEATAVGLGDYAQLAERAYRRILSQQRDDGSFAYYSRGNYGILTDRRSYPRYLSMILYHLLLKLRLQKARDRRF